MFVLVLSVLLRVTCRLLCSASKLSFVIIGTVCASTDNFLVLVGTDFRYRCNGIILVPSYSWYYLHVQVIKYLYDVLRAVMKICYVS